MGKKEEKQANEHPMVTVGGGGVGKKSKRKRKIWWGILKNLCEIQ